MTNEARFRRTILIAGLVTALAPALTLTAAETSVDLTKLKSLSIEEVMQIQIPTVYGASKHEQMTTDAPSSVTVVTRMEIQAYGHRTLADILRSVRDFYVTDDGNYGYVGVRGFNRPGDFGGRILLLVDGMRINDPVYDAIGVLTDFPVDVDMIERVEVIRGPGSSLYGNNAFFAVINVVTRTGEDIGGAEVSGEVGSDETYKGRLTYGRAFENGISLLLTGTHYSSAGTERIYYKEFDHPETNRGIAEGRDADTFTSAGATISYKGFTLQGLYLSRAKDIPSGSYDTLFNHPDASTLDENTFVRLGYARELDNELSVRAGVSASSYHYSGGYPAGEVGTRDEDATIFRDMVDARWLRAELEISKQLWKAHRLTLGAEYQDNYKLKMHSYDMNPDFRYPGLQTSKSTFGIFLQDEWAITKKLTVNAGLRYVVQSSITHGRRRRSSFSTARPSVRRISTRAPIPWWTPPTAIIWISGRSASAATSSSWSKALPSPCVSTAQYSTIRSAT
jgi:outer membrane receptor for ferrienterochelin and colicins